MDNLTPKEFAKECVEAAQAVLAVELDEGNQDKVIITNTQQGKGYKLTFERVG